MTTNSLKEKPLADRFSSALALLKMRSSRRTPVWKLPFCDSETIQQAIYSKVLHVELAKSNMLGCPDERSEQAGLLHSVPGKDKDGVELRSLGWGQLPVISWSH